MNNERLTIYMPMIDKCQRRPLTTLAYTFWCSPIFFLSNFGMMSPKNEISFYCFFFFFYWLAVQNLCIKKKYLQPNFSIFKINSECLLDKKKKKIKNVIEILITQTLDLHIMVMHDDNKCYCLVQSSELKQYKVLGYNHFTQSNICDRNSSYIGYSIWEEEN